MDVKKEKNPQLNSSETHYKTVCSNLTPLYPTEKIMKPIKVTEREMDVYQDTAERIPKDNNRIFSSASRYP